MRQEFAPGYFISEEGDVFGLRGTQLNPWMNRGGYLRMCVYRPTRKHHAVHRLVAKAFVPNPRPDLFDQVDHIDQNKTNNHFTNLRWVTNQLNKLNNDSVGAYKDGRKWQARCRVNGTLLYLGSYETEQEASVVARKFRQDTFDLIYNQLLTSSPADA